MNSHNKVMKCLSLSLTAALFACSAHQTHTEAKVAAAKAPPAWSCPKQTGKAPSGEITATRISAANTTRTEKGLFEGPVWIGDSLYYSDFIFSQGFSSRIMRLGPDGKVTIAIDNSGSNGLATDGQGNILAATHDRKALSRYNPTTGERQILVSTYNGNPFNSPNDLTQTRSGVIYFTDPDYQSKAAPGGQPLTRVYQVIGDQVTVVDESIDKPNGISLSPDQSTLYVAGGGALTAYPLTAQGVGKGVKVASIFQPDGMAIDCLGNIYASEHGEKRIRVLSPKGEQMAVINVDANITNSAFGGPDHKTLFITGAGAVWKVDLDVAGFPY